jgi:hypothetical protein
MGWAFSSNSTVLLTINREQHFPSFYLQPTISVNRPIEPARSQMASLMDVRFRATHVFDFVTSRISSKIKSFTIHFKRIIHCLLHVPTRCPIFFQTTNDNFHLKWYTDRYPCNLLSLLTTVPLYIVSILTTIPLLTTNTTGTTLIVFMVSLPWFVFQVPVHHISSTFIQLFNKLLNNFTFSVYTVQCTLECCVFCTDCSTNLAAVDYHCMFCLWILSKTYKDTYIHKYTAYLFDI